MVGRATRLQNISLQCVKMCHHEWFNKELSDQQIGSKRLGEASRDREVLGTQNKLDMQEEKKPLGI